MGLGRLLRLRDKGKERPAVLSFFSVMVALLLRRFCLCSLFLLRCGMRCTDNICSDETFVYAYHYRGNYMFFDCLIFFF